MKGYLEQGMVTMLLQATAIEAAARRLDTDAFERAVQLLSSGEGKVVVSGAGTSGIIARKIAATLTSTGTAASFLHPGDALHGGLGIVMPNDVAVLVSNSGETDEVLALLPYLKSRKVSLIALVGNMSSTMATRSDVVLDASADREACPLNLAPTASTSVALALGDALAMTVMAVKGVTAESFALNHPSGRLGRRLTLLVRDLLPPGQHPTVAHGDTWHEVVRAITAGGLGAVTVEEPERRLVGIITDGDVRRRLQESGGGGLEELRAEQIMTPDPVSVAADMLAYDALDVMENRPAQIGVLAVVDASERCVGIIRLHDLVRSGI